MNLTLEMCRELPVPWPLSSIERDDIVKELNSLGRQIEGEVTYLNSLTMIKSGLTSDLLTGRVPVPETIATGPSS